MNLSAGEYCILSRSGGGLKTSNQCGVREDCESGDGVLSHGRLDRPVAGQAGTCLLADSHRNRLQHINPVLIGPIVFMGLKSSVFYQKVLTRLEQGRRVALRTLITV